MSAISKRLRKLVKLAKYSTNAQKETTFGSINIFTHPPKEEIDFVLGDGTKRDLRAAKLQIILDRYILHQDLKNREHLELQSQLEDEIIRTKEELEETKKELASTEAKWKEDQNGLMRANEKLLRMTNNFNVRGALEFVMADILSKEEALTENSGGQK
jgi:hypothetical protein